MTREEATEYLIDVVCNCDTSCDKEALRLAIEALLQPIIGHCANCKWCEEIVENKYVCNYQNSLVLGSYVEPDFFCKYWEEGIKQ